MMPQSIVTSETLIALFWPGNICSEMLASPWSDDEKGAKQSLGKSEHVLSLQVGGTNKLDQGSWSSRVLNALGAWKWQPRKTLLQLTPK
jgi:hypothetical protein